MRTLAHSTTSGLALALCLSASTPIWAQALQQQHQLAFANDANLQAAVQRHQATEEFDNIAKAAFRPVLSAGTTQSFATDTNTSRDIYNASLALSLRIDALYAADSSEASIQQSSLNLQASQQKLLADVITNYFNVVKQQAQIDSISAQIKSAQQSLATVQKQQELGLATLLQAANVENNVQQLNLSLLQAQQGLQQARNSLSLSTGEPLTSELPGIDLSNPLPTIDNLQLEHWWDLTKQGNLSLLAASAGVQKAYHDYQQTDAGKYPTGSISANHYSYQSDNIALTISGKLYDGGLNAAQTQQARLTWQASQQTLTANQRSTKQQLDNMLYNLRNNQQQIDLQTSLLASAQTSLDATRKEYDLGVTDLVAVLEAEQKVATTGVNLIKARYDQLVFQTSLKQLAGSLNETDLLALDKLLN